MLECRADVHHRCGIRSPTAHKRCRYSRSVASSSSSFVLKTSADSSMALCQYLVTVEPKITWDNNKLFTCKNQESFLSFSSLYYFFMWVGVYVCVYDSGPWSLFPLCVCTVMAFCFCVHQEWAPPAALRDMKFETKEKICFHQSLPKMERQRDDH